MRAHARVRVGVALGATILAAGLASCRGPHAAGSGLPPPPPTPHQSLGSTEPPVVWIGGTVQDVTPDTVRMHEGSGSLVTLRRLAEGATTFFRLSGDAWEELDPGAFVAAGEPACVETLMDSTNLLAIRVFLGAGCGPIR